MFSKIHEYYSLQEEIPWISEHVRRSEALFFWDCLFSCCASRNTAVVAQFFSGVTFLSSSCGWRNYGMSLHRMCWKENSSLLDAFSYSFVSFPNLISLVPYVKGCMGLQPWIMSKPRFLQQDTLHTPMREGPAPRWS